MNLTEAMEARHSVRQYKNKPLEAEGVSVLQVEIRTCNKESGLHIQLITNEPKAFDGFMAHYGKFSGVTNYIAMIGKKDAGLEEKYSKIKTAFVVDKGEKLCVVIALGYGETPGIEHKSRPIKEVTKVDSQMPVL